MKPNPVAAGETAEQERRDAESAAAQRRIDQARSKAQEKQPNKGEQSGQKEQKPHAEKTKRHSDHQAVL